jgi:H+/Cl- antiporter ClcA
MGKSLSILLLPAIFVGTILTHLCGGSAGREGAALQMGGDIGYHMGLLFRMDDRDMRTATLCGMAAFFSALFGTPLTATVFAMVVISVGVVYHAAFIPCFTASLVAYGISLWVGVSPTQYTVAAPVLELTTLLRVAILGALCAFVSVLFCNALRATGGFLCKHIPNAWLRVVCGGVVIIVLSYLVQTSDYNGAGMDVIQRAVEQGTVSPAAFFLKIVFTAITLGSGYKGGEVVPAFFVGATFGCVAGPLLGLPAGFSAAVGLAAVFCGCVNCPVASIFLSVELFGSAGMLYFALACGISYMLSGYNGLYSSQTILYSKLKAQYINAHTNSYHAGDVLPDHSDLRSGE